MHDVIEHTIQVSFRHRVLFTDRVFDPANPTLRGVLTESGSTGMQRALLVADEGLFQARPALSQEIVRYFEAHGDRLRLAGSPLVMEGGERVKNSYFHVSEVHSHIEREHIDRHAFVIALGGGALLDMVGLAAATAHRGCRHVRIPTTTLSQADSGVGVKNGINAFGKKNFIGTFAPPQAVINDFALLDSLSPRDKRAGYVEAVKVALIRDRPFFETLERDADRLARFEPDAMRPLIRRSAELHARHIATGGDPFEFGSARPLDFGHWAAHKLEPMSEYRIRHGEAVAIGIALDTLYSGLQGWLPQSDTDRILTLLRRLGFNLFTNELLLSDSNGRLLVLNGLDEFREHLGGALTITLLRGIGVGFEIHELDHATVTAAIRELQNRANPHMP
jgi:3-dehydroquinate synthase